MAFDHDIRKTKSEQSRAVLMEVASLGVAQGLFTVTKSTSDDEGKTWRFVELLTPDGLTFQMSVGSWNKEGAICASIGSIDRDGIKVHLSDTVRRTQDVEASASYARGAAAILKDLMRRVIAHPDGIAGAQAVRDQWEATVARRANLRAHIATLKGLGFDFREVPERESYSARGYGRVGDTSRSITVYENGHVTFEADCDVARLSGVLALLDGAPPSP